MVDQNGFLISLQPLDGQKKLFNETVQYTALASFLINTHNACLDEYLTLLRSKGAPFDTEDRFVARVRVSTILDALIDGFQKKKIDQLSDYFQEVARQLLGAGYNFDHIKIIYDSLEASILNCFDNAQPATNLVSGVQSVKNTIALARTIAINQYMLQVNSAAILQNSPKQNSPSANSTPRTYYQSLQQINTNYTTTFGAANTKTDRELGFLHWPLKQIMGTKPPEYLAYLDNGTSLQALLVDRPEAYQAGGGILPNRVRCYIRKIGPLVLAYPL